MSDTKINDGGPAFPHHETTSTGEPYHDHLGMTLRDWFAGQALQGRAHRFDSPWEHRDILAKDCYDIADAMLAARKEKV